MATRVNPLLFTTEMPFGDLPESDGKPIGETDFHIHAILHLFALLDVFFRAVEKIYVGADMLLYYDQGPPAAFVVPDVFVVKGVSKNLRRTYRMWEERVAPAVIFEITSKSTHYDDLGTKRGLYEMLGVREYFLFDPLDEYLKPRLQGFQLDGAALQPISANADGTLFSRELGLTLHPEDSLLRLVNPATGEFLPTLDKALDRADRAEEEIVRLRAELEQLRRERKA